MKTQNILAALLIVTCTANAQWTNSGNDIVNINSGSVLVGSATNPPSDLKTYGRIYTLFPKSNNPLLGEFFGTSGYWGLRTDTDNRFHLDIYNNNNPYAVFSIDQAGKSSFAGNLGIGIAQPLGKLHAVGSIYSNATRTNTIFSGTPADNANFIGSEGYWALRTATNNSFNLDVYNSSNVLAALTVLQNGAVGVGTSAPTSRLDVNGILQTYPSANAGTTGALKLRFAASSSATVVEANNDGAWVNHDLIINSSSPAGSNSNQLVVHRSGNVGIGNASPLAKLSTVGSIWANATRTNTVFSGTPGASNANFIGSEGYWALRTATDNSFNLDVYNASNVMAAITVLQNGNTGIGTNAPGSFKLAVNGKIWTQEVNVAMTNPGPDYVFEKDYDLISLSELKAYINQNKHLPEVPSAKEMEADGLNLKEMNLLLLKKVEELTLHLIKQNEKLAEQDLTILNLNDRLTKIEKK